ncbi:MAG TPA: zinc ribbon domain-containing protein [Blastocatellia bacterium]|nr:zinc ribbon domain-containing protein [Blastocatellia bacterium]
MFCPNCGSQNADGTTYCRTCGSNLSLVPQALTGKLADDRDSRRKRRRHREEGPPNLAKGLTHAFMGVGFFIVALAIFFSPGGRGWWWAMLFPAFSLLGKGIAEIVSVRTAMQHLQNHPTTNAMPPRRQTGELPPEPQGYTLPPPSVTEQTTRHLDADKDRYSQRS